LSKKTCIFLLIVVSVIFIDQVTKALVVRNMSLYDSHTVIKHLFNITYVRNPGAAFGFLGGFPFLFRYVFFITVTLGAVLLIIYYLRVSKAEYLPLISALAFIFAGAVGNLVDRARFGEVIDFLDFYIGKYHWPAFNVADSAITIGSIALAALMILKRKTKL
jgi:signal peptidase II